MKKNFFVLFSRTEATEDFYGPNSFSQVLLSLIPLVPLLCFLCSTKQKGRHMFFSLVENVVGLNLLSFQYKNI